MLSFNSRVPNKTMEATLRQNKQILMENHKTVFMHEPMDEPRVLCTASAHPMYMSTLVTADYQVVYIMA